ncbi:hypothetical protein AAIH25_09585 [Arthrobacter crystallopoietes]|jgi:hypothetical protein|uniref:hypothetical protein n=1 Tax=Micrococcaceae TaxID=1268 RepID=UPI0021C7D63D|nr:hypothetical protein [Arthrobacter sp. Marseille-P9274]
MTSSSNEPYSPEAEEADRQWQQMPAGPEDDGDEVLAPPPAAPEANEADLLEQSLPVNPDEDDEYPHGAAEEYAAEEYAAEEYEE